MPAPPPLLLHMGKLKQRVWQKRHVGLIPREAVGTEPSALPNPTHCKSICGTARSMSVSPTARRQPWEHAPQVMLSCGSVPSWPHGLSAGAGEVQALRHSDLFHLFPQPVISIAARVCNYPQLFIA